MNAPDFVAECFEQLRALPPVMEIRTHGEEHRAAARILVELETEDDEVCYRFIVRPILVPTRAAIESAAAELRLAAEGLRRRPITRRWRAIRTWEPMICAPHLGRDLIDFAVSLGLHCVDSVGNGHLALGLDHYIHVEGRPAPRRPTRSKVIRTAGYRVLFGLMAEPELLNAPLREAAEEVETSVGAVKSMKEWLTEHGYVVRTRAGLQWSPASYARLRELWLVGYQTVLRPSLIVGEIDLGWHPQLLRDPEAREAEIERRLLGSEVYREWPCWGGGSAAFRIDGHYRDPVSTLHVDVKIAGDKGEALRDFATLLGGRPARRGVVRILDVPSTLALGDASEGELGVAHPLLVYAEAMLSDDPRTREAAHEIWRHTGFETPGV